MLTEVALIIIAAITISSCFEVVKPEEEEAPVLVIKLKLVHNGMGL